MLRKSGLGGLRRVRFSFKGRVSGSKFSLNRRIAPLCLTVDFEHETSVEYGDFYASRAMETRCVKKIGIDAPYRAVIIPRGCEIR
jgi:hypothetical protein